MAVPRLHCDAGGGFLHGAEPPDGYRQSREGHGGVEVGLVEVFHDSRDIGFEILHKAAFQATLAHEPERIEGSSPQPSQLRQASQHRHDPPSDGDLPRSSVRPGPCQERRREVVGSLESGLEGVGELGREVAAGPLGVEPRHLVLVLHRQQLEVALRHGIGQDGAGRSHAFFGVADPVDEVLVAPRQSLILVGHQEGASTRYLLIQRSGKRRMHRAGGRTVTRRRHPFGWRRALG